MRISRSSLAIKFGPNETLSVEEGKEKGDGEEEGEESSWGGERK